MGRTRLPPAVRAITTDERRLAWGLTTDGLALVATPTSLYAGTEQLAWVGVEKVIWQPPLLTLVEVADVEGTGARRSWSLDQDAKLAETVRACVTSSVGWTDRRSLGAAGHVRLVGRRTPDRDALTWQVVWESADADSDASLRAQAERWVEELRGSIG
ncbi:MAG: hypothetical protein JWM40_2537 [Frankiales bacterium]|nr:hypothetical protein [Frankiales bacterium]